MKKIILNLIKFIVDSNLWIALATALFYFLTLIQLGKPLKFSATVFFLFFSSLFIYTLFQILDKELQKTDFSKLIVAFSFIAILICIPFLSYATLLLLVLSGLLTFFYATPLFSIGKNNFNFRKFWFLKSIIVALVWTLSCSVVPLLENEANRHQLVWFSVEKFLFILGLSILYDIKDIPKDKLEKGMTSFVMKFGIQKTKWISGFIHLFGYGLAVILFNQSILVISIPYLFSLVVNYKLEEKMPIYGFTFWIDASIILYFLAFWFSVV